jgi:hypothetical protein
MIKSMESYIHPNPQAPLEGVVWQLMIHLPGLEVMTEFPDPLHYSLHAASTHLQKNIIKSKVKNKTQ